MSSRLTDPPDALRYIKMADDDETGRVRRSACSAAAAPGAKACARAMAARGLSRRQRAPAATFSAISGRRPPRRAALTARLGLSKQAVQQLLDQLESAGLVRREPDPADKRAKQRRAHRGRPQCAR